MPANTEVTRTASAGGEISSGSVYTIAEFSLRTGLGKWALRQLRRDGLLVRRVHGRTFVLGTDFIDFLSRGITHNDPSSCDRNGKSK